jgi:hypothetical protein
MPRLIDRGSEADGFQFHRLLSTGNRRTAALNSVKSRFSPACYASTQ